MRLPIEVSEGVIDQASDDTASLRDLSLTCVAFLPRSRFHLFSSILIQTVEQMESSRDFLDKHLWLLPLVHKVVLRFGLDEDHSGPNVRVLDVVPVDFLTRLPNLHAWSMKQKYHACSMRISLSLHRTALSLYWKHSSRIHSLDLSFIEFYRFSDFAGLVSSFTHVHTLTCSHFITFERKEEFKPHIGSKGLLARPLQLSTLIISRNVDICAVEHLLDRCGAALTSLSLDLDSDSNLERLESLDEWMGRISHLLLLKLSVQKRGRQNIQPFTRTIRSATKILKSVKRTCLTDVEVEIKVYTIATLGSCLSGLGSDALLENCRLLEEALLAFPSSRVLVCDSDETVDLFKNAGRTGFWPAIIEPAFPILKQRGRLIFHLQRTTGTGSHDDSSNPICHEDEVTSLIASHDSRWIVTASFDDNIIIWDSSSSKVLHKWLAHQGGVIGLALSPNSQQLVSAGRHTTVVVWAINDEVQKAASLEGHVGPAETCAWSPNGTLIASASKDGTVCIWDGHAFQERDIFLDPDQPRALQFSPDSRYVAWISGNNCRVWRPLMQEVPMQIPSHPDCSGIATNDLSFDPESNRIATAHGNSYPNEYPDTCVVRVWDVATGACLAKLVGHSRFVKGVAFSPDGRSLLSNQFYGSSTSATIWDADSGKPTVVIGEGSVNKDLDWSAEVARYSPNGQYIATSSHTGRVRLWKVGDVSCIAAGIVCDGGHIWRETNIVFTPCGEFLAYGDSWGIVHIHALSDFIGC